MLLSNIFVDKMSQGPHIGNPPVHIGDELEVKIERILKDGEGVAKIGKLYSIYVEGDSIKVGDTVKVAITELMPGYASAIIIK